MRWIIGDIHGMIRPLKTLLETIGKRDSEADLLFAGDYVNRGLDSRGVIDLLLSLPNARFVRGNHDDIFDQVLHGRSYAENAPRENRIAAFQWFMKYGLDNTFLSYGADIAYLHSLAARPSIEGLDALVQWVPDAHRQFIRELPPALEFDDLFVVHGKWDPNEPSESPGILARLENEPALRHPLLWGRFTSEEVMRLKAWRRTGYFGHTPVSQYAHLPHLFPRFSAKLLQQLSAPAADTSADDAMEIGAISRKGRKESKRKETADGAMLPIVGNHMVLLDTGAALGFNGRLTAFCPDMNEYIQASHFGELISVEE